MKTLLSVILTVLWSSTAIAYDIHHPEQELRKLAKADQLLIQGELESSNALMRELIPTFEEDRLLTGLTKMAVIYLELGKPMKARVYISELQVRLLGRQLTPHYSLKLSASYLQAGRLEEARSALDMVLSGSPIYQKEFAEDIKMIQAMIDLKEVSKASRGMILLDRKIKDFESSKNANNTAAAVTN